MPTCVTNGNQPNSLVISTDPTNDCPYQLLSAQDYIDLQNAVGSTGLNQVLSDLVVLLDGMFSTPTPGEITEVFLIGFSLPVICYLTAWGYGVLINWFDPKHD